VYSEPESPYIGPVVSQIPRLMSRMDRERCSATYGSFDRTYWSWKFTDFSGPRFQEALFAVSWMYTSSLPNNSMYCHESVKAWVVAGFLYWAKRQHRDGSFDEAYPYERSLAATAFTTFYLGEAFLRAQECFTPEQSEQLVEVFQRSGAWLCNNDEYHGTLSNHLAAAAGALEVISLITKDKRYSDRSGYFIERILSSQSSEGWYEEYGGADFGYQTHGAFYLARVWQLTGDERLLDSLKCSSDFLSKFVHPNGTLGGEYGSRNTSFYFPAAFEILAPVCHHSRAIAKFMRSSINGIGAVGLAQMDSYNLCPMMNNYIYAHEMMAPIDDATTLPFERSSARWDFPHAGLIVNVTESYQAVFAPSKGGVLKIYDKEAKSLALSDCGYWGNIGNKRVSSQSFSLNNVALITGIQATVVAPFALVNQKLMSPLLFTCFRIFSITIGRHHVIAKFIKNLLVRALVSKRKKYAITLERKVTFNSSSVEVNDEIREGRTRMLQPFKLEAKFSTIHMGSSRYFQFDELDCEGISEEGSHRRYFKWSK